jgi:hypothetical protein
MLSLSLSLASIHLLHCTDVPAQPTSSAWPLVHTHTRAQTRTSCPSVSWQCYTLCYTCTPCAARSVCLRHRGADGVCHPPAPASPFIRPARISQCTLPRRRPSTPKASWVGCSHTFYFGPLSTGWFIYTEACWRVMRQRCVNLQLKSQGCVRTSHGRLEFFV